MKASVWRARPGWRDYARGHRALAAGDPGRALRFFRSAADKSSTEAWFRYGLARAYSELNRHDDSERAAREAVRLDPEDPWMHHALASALFALGSSWEARAEYDTAIELDPDDPWLWLGRARFSRSLGALDEAVADFRAACDLAPDEGSVFFEFGEFLISRNKPGDARDVLEEAVRLQPDDPYTRVALGEALVRLGDRSAAEDMFRSAVSLDPDDAWLHHRLAQVLVEQDRASDAVREYREALAGQPSTPWLHNELGDVLAAAGQMTESRDSYRQALVAQLRSSPAADHMAADHMDVQVEIGGEPDFLIIGFPKCGTTALYAYLTEIPGIVPASRKEPEYFTRRYELGRSWYRSQFAAVTKPRITGEASALYSVHSEAPSRVLQDLPESRLVAVVRDPVDRAVSDYMMWLRTGAEQRSFRQAVTEEMAALESGGEITADRRHPAYLASGLYAAHLDRWMSGRSGDELIIVRAEDLVDNPVGVLIALCRFLGLNSDIAVSERRENVGSSLLVEDDLRRVISDFYRSDQAELIARYRSRFIELS